MFNQTIVSVEVSVVSITALSSATALFRGSPIRMVVWIGLVVFLLTTLLSFGLAFTWSAIVLSLFVGLVASTGWSLIKPDAPADRVFASATTTSVVGLGLALWTAEFPPSAPWEAGGFEDWQAMAFQALGTGLVGSILAVRDHGRLSRDTIMYDALSLGGSMAICTVLVSILGWTLFGTEAEPILPTVFHGFIVGLAGGLTLALLRPETTSDSQSAGAITTWWARAIRLRAIIHWVGLALLTIVVGAVTIGAMLFVLGLVLMVLGYIFTHGGWLAVALVVFICLRATA